MVMTLAQLTNPVLPKTIGEGGTEAGGTAVGLFVGGLVGLLFIVAFLLAFFFLVTGGIQWLASEGDKAGLEAARNKITHAIVGLIIVGAAWAIMTLVAQFFGMDLTKLTIPSLNR